MPMVRLSGVHKRFGAQVVLSGIDLAVARGEVFGLLGANGSGKTTALNILCGLSKSDAGSVQIDGQSLPQARHLIGLCAQQPALYRDLRPAENLDFLARLHGLRGPLRRDRVAMLMQRFDLHTQGQATAAQLSSGWQQRLNLACALVHAPAVLVLDEPTAAVDAPARTALAGLLDELRASGITIVMTTHQISEAERLCDRVGVLSGGRLVACDTVSKLLAAVPGRAVATLRTEDERSAIVRATHQGWPQRRFDGQLSFLLPEQLALRDVVAVFDGVAVSAVAVVPVSLEHAYLEAMAGAAAADGMT